MGTAGTSGPAAAWPATAAARRAQRSRSVALTAAGGVALAVAALALAVAVVRAGGDLDQPAGPEMILVLLGVSAGLPLLGFGLVGGYRWRRLSPVLDRAPWVVAAGSAVAVHGGRVRQRPTVLAAVALADGDDATVLTVVDSAAGVARLHVAADQPLWVTRLGAGWVVSPAGGATPLHARPAGPAATVVAGREGIAAVRARATAAAAGRTGPGRIGPGRVGPGRVGPDPG